MTEYDVAVIGGGPAGLNAALVLSRARRRVALIDRGAPRNAPAAHMHGFLSRDGSPPAELLATGRAEVTGYGGHVIEDRVTAIEPGFTVRPANSPELTARRILIATGLRDELADIPGLRERWGRDVLHCPYCHGYEVRDQPIGVIGGSPDAVFHALLVRQWSPDVVFFPHTGTVEPAEYEQLTARGIRIAAGQVMRVVVGDDQLRGLELADGTVVPRAAVFVRPRFVPFSELLVGLGCAVDANGWTAVDSTGRTSVAGVWAAGNAVDPRAQVITAAGQGSAAAIDLHADLVTEDVQRAMRYSHSST